MYYKLCNMCLKLCNACYKLCNKLFLADSKKYQAESENFLLTTKKFQAGILVPNPAQMQGCDGFVFPTRHFYSFDI